MTLSSETPHSNAELRQSPAPSAGEDPQLRISEIYASVQGESTHAGRPCVFVRLTGCPLRCQWCDTSYAFSGGERQLLSEVVATSLQFGLDTVEVTGGEPLAQPAAIPLLKALCDHFPRVLLETSGALSTAEVDPRVHIILDIKAPGSGESHRNDESNWRRLRSHDEVKFVLADRSDYEWAREIFKAQAFAVPVHFSPVHGKLDPQPLVDWIVEDRLTARLQLQQHKYIWDPTTKGV